MKKFSIPIFPVTEKLTGTLYTPLLLLYIHICWVRPTEYKENNSYFPEKEQVGTVKTDSIKHYKVYRISSSTGPTRYNPCPVHSSSNFVQAMKWLHIQSKLYFFHLLYGDQVTPATSKWSSLETEGWTSGLRVVVPLGYEVTSPNMWASVGWGQQL